MCEASNMKRCNWIWSENRDCRGRLHFPRAAWPCGLISTIEGRSVELKSWCLEVTNWKPAYSSNATTKKQDEVVLNCNGKLHNSICWSTTIQWVLIQSGGWREISWCNCCSIDLLFSVTFQGQFWTAELELWSKHFVKYMVCRSGQFVQWICSKGLFFLFLCTFQF